MTAIGNIGFKGNAIPDKWYSRIKHANGKPNLVAIIILSELVFRCQTVDIENGLCRHEFTGEPIQKTYKQMSKRLGVTERQAADSLKFLEEEGYVILHFRTVELENGLTANNVLFVELVPAAIEWLTESEDEGAKPERISPRREKHSGKQ